MSKNNDNDTARGGRRTRAYIKGRAQGYLEGLEASAAEVGELARLLEEALRRERRAVGVVSDVERTRGESAAVLDEHASASSARRPVYGLGSLEARELEAKRARRDHSRFIATGRPERRPPPGYEGLVIEQEQLEMRIAALEDLQNENGPRLALLETLSNVRHDRATKTIDPSKPNHEALAVDNAREVAIGLRERGEHVAAQMLENFATCWWEAENRVRDWMRRSNEHSEAGERMQAELSTARLERDKADALRGGLASVCARVLETIDTYRRHHELVANEAEIEREGEDDAQRARRKEVGGRDRLFAAKLAELLDATAKGTAAAHGLELDELEVAYVGPPEDDDEIDLEPVRLGEGHLERHRPQSWPRGTTPPKERPRCLAFGEFVDAPGESCACVLDAGHPDDDGQGGHRANPPA